MQTIQPLKKSKVLAKAGQSAISRVGAAVGRAVRAGKSVADLHQGEPDFDTPENVKEAAIRAIRANDTHYTALAGTNALKEAIQIKFKRDNGLTFETDEIVAATGAKMLLFAALLATVGEGEEVIIPVPCWGSYLDIVGMTGAAAVVIETREEDGFRMRPEDLERAITPQTRWLMLNSPSNPSGAVYERAHYEAVLDVLARHPHVWLLADDMYEHIVYDDANFITPLQIRPELRNRTFTVNGVSKAYAMTGWRIGYGAGPVELIDAILPILSQSTSSPCSIAQAAAVEALRGPQEIVEQYRQEYQARRALVAKRIAAIPELTLVVPQGAFYAFPSWKKLVGSRAPSGETIATDEQFCHYLLQEHGLAAIPGDAFGAPGHIRMSFASSTAVLEDAMARLRTACATLAGSNVA